MSKFIELSQEEQENVNGGGATDVMSAIAKWIFEKIGLYDPDRKPLIPY